LEIKTCEKIKNGDLTRGCKQCIEGRKSVLFITGKCHYQCFYCPISDDKRGVDIVKINEFVVEQPDSPQGLLDIIKEIKLCQSLGVGITGGDPLLVIDRTCEYIKALKKSFGKQFHIHLYTSLQCVTQDRLFALEKAGLDELRFHVPIENISLWEKIEFAKDLNMLVGVEIPAIPGMLEKTKELVYYCKNSCVIKFINLNELEFSDVSEETLTEKGYYVKNELSYGIRNSEDLAKVAVEYGKEINFPVHYCSASFKDKIQLGNRLLLRAQSVAKPYDTVDEQGMLTRGEIILTSQGLAEAFDGEFNIKEIKDALQDYYDIPEDMLDIEDKRIIIAPWILEEIYRDIQDHKEDFLFGDYIEAFIVKEYPTADHFSLERTPL
jgi:pyruvate formate-lyase activating enzyme-like uncharacterized protein